MEVRGEPPFSGCVSSAGKFTAMCVSFVYESSRVGEAGCAGSVLATAPATLAVEGALVPITFVAVIYTVTTSSSTKEKGATRSVATGT
jgi:hypothetical protein